MKKQKLFVALAVVLSLGTMLLFAGCGGSGGGSGDAGADVALLAGKGAPESLSGLPVSDEGVVPDTYPGNFVSSSDDDQVCYDLAALGYIGEVTDEMRGIKVDPPGPFSDDFVSVTVTADGKFLSWESFNATMLAFIVKGGPNYNVYDYVGTGYTSDSGLGAPPNGVNKKTNEPAYPQISHYNFCYQPDVPEGDQGCTPGYWRNHADRWLGVAPGDDFDTTFGVDLFDPDITLGQAISLGGGDANALARHATAALLNAYGGVPNADGTTVAYPYTVAEVIQMVQDAVANGTIEATKDLLAAANELGCPLGGTRAVPVE